MKKGEEKLISAPIRVVLTLNFSNQVQTKFKLKYGIWDICKLVPMIAKYKMFAKPLRFDPDLERGNLQSRKKCEIYSFRSVTCLLALQYGGGGNNARIHK